MADEAICSVRLVMYRGKPYVESRIRPLSASDGGPIPNGKILVMRSPVFAGDEGASSTEEELIDDDGTEEAFCPECAAGGHEPPVASFVFPGGGRKLGRNDPCPCGSGRKYKRCCIN